MHTQSGGENASFTSHDQRRRPMIASNSKLLGRYKQLDKTHGLHGQRLPSYQFRGVEMKPSRRASSHHRVLIAMWL
jgi:hypothetical protein